MEDSLANINISEDDEDVVEFLVAPECYQLFLGSFLTIWGWEAKQKCLEQLGAFLITLLDYDVSPSSLSTRRIMRIWVRLGVCKH
ncbi:hypothetical protein GQ457_06G016240 [Hibiscus cannabinus]